MALGDVTHPDTLHRLSTSINNNKPLSIRSNAADRYDVESISHIPVPSTPETVGPKIFDSSQIYDKHPRKFCLLTMDDPGGDTKGSTPGTITQRKLRSATVPDVMQSSSDTPPKLVRRTSDGLLNIPQNVDVGSSQVNVSQKVNHFNEAQDLKAPVMIRSEGLKLQNKPTRRVTTGDLYSSKYVGQFANSEGLIPDDNKTISAVGTLESNTGAKTKPKMRRVTDSALLERKHRDDTELHVSGQQTGGLSWLFKTVISSGAPLTTNTPTEGIPELTSTSTTTTDNNSSASAPPHSTHLVPLTIQPEPRRLFGFGPKFQPPSETVMVPAGDFALLQRIKQEGLENTVKAPTKAEMNTFAPFSM